MTKAKLRLNLWTIIGIIFMLTVFLFNIFKTLLVFMWMWMRMRMRGVVLTVYAFASISACYSSIEALAIFFLTLWFFAYASLSWFARWLAFYLCLGFFHEFIVFLCVETTITSALRCASFAWWEALTVSF